MPERRPLPGWPRALRQPEAAAYVGVSEAAFRNHVMPLVASISPTPGTRAWLREDLDAYLDGLRNHMPASRGDNPWPE